jgi:hypothetical protein
LSRVVDRAGQAALRTLAGLGIYSREFRFRFERHIRRGAHIDNLRRKRGLAPLSPRDPTPDDLRSVYRPAARPYRIGEAVDHSFRGRGYLVRDSGWTVPAEDGVNSTGDHAGLFFALAEAFSEPLILEIAASTIGDSDTRVSVTVDGVAVGEWTATRAIALHRIRLAAGGTPTTAVRVDLAFAGPGILVRSTALHAAPAAS